MSSFNRQHHGQSRPPPDRNRPGYHPPSSTVPQDVHPHYLQYLRSQAEQINPTTSSELNSDPNYTIQLLNGNTTTVPLSIMDKLIDTKTDSIHIQMPSWIQHQGTERYTVGRTTHQGRLNLDDKQNWSFTVRNKLGSIIKQIQLPNLQFTFQSMINENILQPNWQSTLSISAYHVSASNLKHPCPTTLSKH